MSPQKTLIKTHIVQQSIGDKYYQLMLLFETEEIGYDLSLMKISYNLTKRTTKTEKIENYLKMYITNLRLKATN